MFALASISPAKITICTFKHNPSPYWSLVYWHRDIIKCQRRINQGRYMKKVIWIAVIAIVGLLAALMWFDEDLDPEVEAIIAKYSAKPNLDNNAYIHLIALGYPDFDYEQAKRDYLRAVRNVDLHGASRIHEVILPQLPVLNELREKDIYCWLTEPGCFDSLRENRQEITRDLTQIEVILDRYLALADIENFEHIDQLAISLIEGDLYTINDFVFHRIYQLLFANELVLARQQFQQYALLQQRFIQCSYLIDFVISELVSTETHYRFFISEYIRLGGGDLEGVFKALQPLTIDQITFNYMLEKDVFALHRLLQPEQMLGPELDESIFTRIKARLLYKPNMMVNERFHGIKRSLVEIEDKSQLSTATELAYEHFNAWFESFFPRGNIETYWYMVKNFRNITGAVMSLAGGPAYLKFTKDIIDAESTKQLLQILILAQSQDLDDVLASEAFINPFTLTAPYRQDDSICYQAASEVCIDLVFQEIQDGMGE